MPLRNLHQAADVLPFDLILQAAALVEQEERSEHSVKSCSISEYETKNRPTNKCNKLDSTSVNGYEADSESTIVEASRDDHRLLIRRNLIRNSCAGSCLFVKSYDRESNANLKNCSTDSTLLIKPSRSRPRNSIFDSEPIQKKHQCSSVFDHTNTKNSSISSLLDKAYQDRNFQVDALNFSTFEHDRDHSTENDNDPTNSAIPSPMLFVEQETREFHNMCEKNRRAHLKNRFDALGERVPSTAGKRCSNLTILLAAARYIVALNRHHVEFEAELRQLVLENCALEKKRDDLLAQLFKLGVDVSQIISSTCPGLASTSDAELTSPCRGLFFTDIDEAEEAEGLCIDSSGSSTDSVPSSTKSNHKIVVQQMSSRLSDFNDCNSSTSTASEGEEGEDREDEATDEASEYGDVEPSAEFLRKLPFRKRFHRMLQAVDADCMKNGAPLAVDPKFKADSSASTSILKRSLTAASPLKPLRHVEKKRVAVPPADELNPQFVNKSMLDIYKLLANVHKKPSKRKLHADTSTPTTKSKSLITTSAAQTAYQQPSATTNVLDKTNGLPTPPHVDSSAMTSQSAALVSRLSVTPEIFAQLLIHQQHSTLTAQNATTPDIFPTFLQVAATSSTATEQQNCAVRSSDLHFQLQNESRAIPARIAPTPIILVPIISNSLAAGGLQLVANATSTITPSASTAMIISQSPPSFVNLTPQTLNELLRSAVTITSAL